VLVMKENLNLLARVFYGPDVLPVTQPIVSKHLRKYKALTSPVVWPQPFFILHQTLDGRGVASKVSKVNSV